MYKKARKSRIDLTGKRFGRLTVLEYAGTGKGGTFWKCKCDCGKITTILSHSLRSGRTTSCGCYNKEVTSKRYCDNLKKVERLQEQLNEANEVIKKYRRFEVALKVEKGTLIGVYPAVDYLKKYNIS